MLASEVHLLSNVVSAGERARLAGCRPKSDAVAVTLQCCKDLDEPLHGWRDPLSVQGVRSLSFSLGSCEAGGMLGSIHWQCK